MALEINDATFSTEVLETKGLVLVDFWGSHCRPCLALAPTIQQLSDEYAGRIKVCKANVEENMNSANMYGISSIPALLLFRDGNVIDQILGNVPKTRIQQMMDAAL